MFFLGGGRARAVEQWGWLQKKRNVCVAHQVLAVHPPKSACVHRIAEYCRQVTAGEGPLAAEDMSARYIH
jgi:hypothetical protein